MTLFLIASATCTVSFLAGAWYAVKVFVPNGDRARR